MAASLSSLHSVCCFLVLALRANSLAAKEPPLPAPVLPEAWNTWPLHLYNAAVSRDGKRIAVHLRESLDTILYDRYRPETEQSISYKGGGSRKLLLFTPNSKRLVGHNIQGREPSGEPNQYAVLIWDAANGKLVRSFDLVRGHGFDYRNYVLTDKILVVPGRDEVAAIYDLETGKLVGTLPGRQRVNRLALSADGKWLLTADTESTLHVWDVQKRVLVNKLSTETNPIEAVAISADGAWCAAATKNRLWAYERTTTLEKARGQTHDKFVAKKLLFTPDGKTLIAVGKGRPRGLFVWDWQSSREMRGGDLPGSFEMILKKHPLRDAPGQNFIGATMLADGSLATWTAASIRFWDLKARKAPATTVPPAAKK